MIRTTVFDSPCADRHKRPSLDTVTGQGTIQSRALLTIGYDSMQSQSLFKHLVTSHLGQSLTPTVLATLLGQNVPADSVEEIIEKIRTSRYHQPNGRERR